MSGTDVVVVTGASAGVGRATVIEFARRRCRIALLARGEEGLEGARRDVEAYGGQALVIPVDVARADQVEAAAETVISAWGRIDIWVNCAMTTVLSEFMDISPRDFRRATDVTYLGYVNGTRAALKRMIPADKGTIVQVSSTLSYRGIPLQSAYCGAKHAIRGFTDSLRCELINRGSRVRITLVHLPAVNTPQFAWSKNNMPRKHQPIPPILQPEVCAEAVAWSAYHHRRDTTVGFSTALAIGLTKIIPGLLDMYLGRTGYDSQQYDGANDPGKEDNLWAPVDKDMGARGDFSDQARPGSLMLAVVKNPVYPYAWAILAAGAALYLLKRKAARRC